MRYELNPATGCAPRGSNTYIPPEECGARQYAPGCMVPVPFTVTLAALSVPNSAVIATQQPMKPFGMEAAAGSVADALVTAILVNGNIPITPQGTGINLAIPVTLFSIASFEGGVNPFPRGGSVNISRTNPITITATSVLGGAFTGVLYCVAA